MYGFHYPLTTWKAIYPGLFSRMPYRELPLIYLEAINQSVQGSCKVSRDNTEENMTEQEFE